MIKTIVNKIPKLNPSVACIGYFDGVHRGHQQLINKTISEAKRLHVESSLICFDPDPLDVIKKCKNPHILNHQARIDKVLEFGIDNIYVIRFTEQFMKTMPDLFIKNYLNKMNLVELISGFDYSFGYKGLGNNALLKKEGNFRTIVIKEFQYYGQKVSSTRIRKALLDGNFCLVNHLLGWNYRMPLIVVSSKKAGNFYMNECVLKDPQGILPKKKIKTKDFCIDSNRVTIQSKQKLKKNDILTIVFENE